jgi:hypothetical protein
LSHAREHVHRERTRKEKEDIRERNLKPLKDALREKFKEKGIPYSVDPDGRTKFDREDYPRIAKAIEEVVSGK